MNSPNTHGMRPADIALFLFGQRGAIERIAATRHAWIVGAILVLSAGISRNYDHLDLLRQPLWFIGPFTASMVSICFIYLWISWPLRLQDAGRYWRQFGTFLVLAWMTAPCAWLYGIPVESMTDILTATKWNIAFLAIVALWRVAIMVRAVSVLTETSWLRALPLVLAPAALEAALGSMFQGLSLVGIMGGIRLPPETQLLVKAAQVTTTTSFGLFIVMVLGTFAIKGVAQRPLYREVSAGSRMLLPVSILMLLTWAAIALPWQPQVANRHRLQTLLNEEDYPAAVAFASGKQRGDFPPHHRLPPEPTVRFPLKLLLILPESAPEWLRKEWFDNLIESRITLPRHFDAKEFAELRPRYPEIAETVTRHADGLRRRAKSLKSEEAQWLRNFEAEQKPPANPPPP